MLRMLKDLMDAMVIVFIISCCVYIVYLMLSTSMMQGEIRKMGANAVTNAYKLPTVKVKPIDQRTFGRTPAWVIEDGHRPYK